MVINKKKTSPVCTKLRCNDSVINDKNEISDKFNTFVVNVGASLAAAIAPSNKNPLEYIKLIIALHLKVHLWLKRGGKYSNAPKG